MKSCASSEFLGAEPIVAVIARDTVVNSAHVFKVQYRTEKQGNSVRFDVL